MSDVSEHEALSAFFSALAERAYKENDLSDVTYALLEANKAFRQFFLDFFFPNEGLVGDQVVIEREHAVGEGRPDFWIRTGGKVYLVEVKIWDGGHHFEQYHEILKEEGAGDKEWARLGYIANYSLRDVCVCENGMSRKASELGCGLHTWKEFANRLESYDCLGDSLVQGYLGYLKSVCPYDDFKVESWKGDLCDFLFVKRFYSSLESAIRATECKIYNSSRATRDRAWMGQYFEWAFGDNPVPVWGWLGVYYTNDGAELCVEFEDREGWGRPVCDAVRQRQPLAVKNGALRFYYEGQPPFDEAVSGFLQEVLTRIERGERVREVLVENRAHEKRLLAMKAFPMLLDSLFREMEDLFREKDSPLGVYDFVSADARDQVKPSEFCGRYFELLPKDKEGQPLEREASKLRGWMGVLYSDGCKYANDGMPRANEPVVEKGTSPVFMIELWGRCLTCIASSGWRKDSWGAVCQVFKDMPSATDIVEAYLRIYINAKVVAEKGEGAGVDGGDSYKV